jgi:precorrin-6B methylase 2
MLKSVNYIVDRLIITSAGKGFLAIYNKISSYLNHRYNYQFLDPHSGLDKEVLHFFKDLVVKHGLFAGMKYPSFKAICSALLPKLSGTYENELNVVFEKIKDNNYELIVDIGCAEGYYAVGLALMFPTTPIYAFDTDSEARKLCHDMALLNQVQDQVIIDGECTIERLSALINGKHCLIISDCEGYEEFLFTTEYQHVFTQSDLIIELHPFQNKNIKEDIAKTLSRGHLIQFISSYDTARKVNELPVEYLHFSNEAKSSIVNEARPYTMDWLIAYSL